VINASKSSYTFKDNPYKIPRWKDRTTKLKAAALVHPDRPAPAVPSAFSTYVHGDVFSLPGHRTSNGQQTEEDKAQQAASKSKAFVDVEPEKQVLVSAFEGIKRSSLVRELEHVEKINRVRHTIQVLTTPVPGDSGGEGEGGDLSLVADLRMVLPLVSAFGEESKIDYSAFKDPFAPVGASRRNSSNSYDSFNTQMGSTINTGSPREGEGSPTHGFGNGHRSVNQQSTMSSLSPRQPSGSASVSAAPSPRKSQGRVHTSSSTHTHSSAHSSRAPSGIGALPPNTTAREVFSGAAGAGYAMKLHAPFRNDQQNTRMSSSGLDNSIPASHHILKQYENYIHADGSAVTGPVGGRGGVQIPASRPMPQLPMKKGPLHKVSLALPKVSFMRQTTPGSAQDGMWTNPSPISTAPPSRQQQQPGHSKPQSPFLKNAVSRQNEFDDVYEAERTKLKNDPLLLAAPIAGFANSIVSVRKAPATPDKERKPSVAAGSGVVAVAVEPGRNSPGADLATLGGPIPRPPQRDKVAATMAHHMNKTVIATQKINK
jgi:hypothetical protein